MCYNLLKLAYFLDFLKISPYYILRLLGYYGVADLANTHQLKEVPVILEPSVLSNSAITTCNYQAYFSMPLLSEIEEKELAEDFVRNQTIESAHKLVLAHMRFVVKIAKNYLGYGLALGELVQEGSVGLMKAVKKFDPTVGVRLVSFAVFWIKSEIHEYVIKNWRTVKIATTKAQRKLFFNMRKLQQQFTDLSISEQHRKIASELDVSIDDVQTMHVRMTSSDFELDRPLSLSESDSATLKDSLQDNTSNLELSVMRDEYNQVMNLKLSVALNQLSEREKEVIIARFFKAEKATLKELSSQLEVSLERVRQIEKSALKKLKGLIQENGD